MKAFRKLAALLISFTAALMFVCCASAASANGISASVSEVRPGDSFTVTLTVPAAEKADTVSVKVEFDGLEFEVTSWEPDISNAVVNHGDGFFAVMAANATRTVDLSGGKTMEAQLKVKSGAADGKYKIRLVSHSISYVEDNGIDYVELWEPTVTEVTVAVTGSAEAGNDKPDDAKKTEDDDNAVGNDPAGGNDTQQTSASDGDVPADNEDENGKSSDNSTTPDTSKNDADNAGQESSDGKAKITLNTVLDGMPDSKVLIATKTGFFDGDVIIEITRPESAQEAASRAVENLGLAGHDSYAFDISVYDKASGKQIITLPDGYVKITMPLPLKFADITEGLAVYHTESGFPQRVNSEITDDNGQLKLVFTVNSFSPYMIVDTVHKAVSASQPAQSESAAVSGQGGGTGKEAQIIDTKDAKNNGKPLNPDTGVAAAVVIPTAVTCCVILARKQSRKRIRPKRKDSEEQ